MVKEPLLVMADSQELIKDLIQADNIDFIIKHNLRRETKEDWLQTAKDHCREKFVPKKKKNQTGSRGSVYREISGRTHYNPLHIQGHMYNAIDCFYFGKTKSY